jgi:hypothetical protein
MHIIAKNSLLKAKEITKRNYDKNAKNYDFNEGDLVLLENIRKGTGQKLQPLRIGPYTILQILSNENVIIDINGKTK